MLEVLDFNPGIETSRKAIVDCDIGDCNHAQHLRGRMAAFTSFDVDEKNQEAVIAGDSIVAIVAGMSAENKQIVKDCMLFANLAADKKFPNGGREWYSRYRDVLTYCGWFSAASGLSDYSASNSRFTMEQEGLTILASAITAMAVPGPTQLLMLKIASDAVKALQASDKPLRLFESSSKTSKGAKFAVASAAESKDGEVVMAMGAVDFNTSLDVTSVLFWEWNRSNVQIKRAENQMVLNQQHFNGVKVEIRKKLNANALSFIADLDI